MRVKWTRTSLANLDAAVKYIARDDSRAAQKVAQKIWDSSQMLALRPALGRLGRVSGTRELIVDGLPYVLPYIQKDDSIYILRVIHTAMRWPDSF
ncbi:MAG: hypothetical protein BA874_03940 [Desulfuromonadales bacterium C00003068]|jgi:plasmid stabilization system protein ParE|nr:MAG: hypothetical protein BA874_03940 [Desulfuromonadales bacterium C00003068]